MSPSGIRSQQLALIDLPASAWRKPPEAAVALRVEPVERITPARLDGQQGYGRNGYGRDGRIVPAAIGRLIDLRV